MTNTSASRVAAPTAPIKWKCGLENKPWEALGFYGVICAAVLLGLAIEFTNIDPISALFWSAVINGCVAVPIMVAMMSVVGKRSVMKEFTAPPMLRIGGWMATVAMAAAVAGMALF